MRSPRPGLALTRASAVALSALLAGPTHATEGTSSSSIRPEYRWLVEAPLAGAGASLLLAGLAVDVQRQAVPPAGLDPSTIHFQIDRSVVGNRDLQARTWSDRFVALAIAYELVLPPLAAADGERLQAVTDRLGMQAEAALLTVGVGQLTKRAVSRPRPFTYLGATERPADPHYDVTQDEAFLSMPSGHAAAGWCAASFALTDYLISNPGQEWPARASVGFTGSVLATATSALRVQAGQHFPTDVLAGAAIGAACGIAVPLLHRYAVNGGDRAPLPSARAWLQGVAGTAVGVGVGLLIAPLF